jgi:hypothetical protein
VTVFHTSQPTDTRPNPLQPPNEFEQMASPQARTGPSPDNLEAERAVLMPIVTSTPRFSLEVPARLHRPHTCHANDMPISIMTVIHFFFTISPVARTL